ncbi:sigma-E processing peptidase SpoIIGA [Sporolactobacillus terrae]|uniref:sigma-E processing peptidase SpoIIGA n=1 Tax=Sporolactobacillus terrae TaxID=269673 RepID=UPI001561DCB5|nr:sigma-E processing peptidase SpoIIGA [Sporolactobacillus terrae]UAK17058.1 sigma-E processing peptidase SpoIIGA [Sporolactobacillus terrae]
MLVVYLDAVWALNLFIDACLLKLTALMLKRQMTWLRLWLGALIASTIVLVLFTPAAFIVEHPLGKLVYSMLIIFTAFGYRRLSVFMQNLAAFYFTAFAIGGGLFAAHYFFQDASFYANSRFLNTMNYGDPISWIFVVLGFPLLWYFAKKRLDQTVVRKWHSSTIAQVSIRFFDDWIHAKAMIDSGNKLVDPLTQTPVMFLEKSVCSSCIPEALIQNRQTSEPLQLESIPEEWRHRLAWIPYRAVDGSSQLTLAIRPDEVVIYKDNKQMACRKALVAFTDHALSSSGDFNSILHPDMLLHGKIIKTAS